ncbi:NfeD family protein [Bacteroidota bacterium]
MIIVGIILLIVFGILLLLLEFFVVPGLTISGIFGFLLLGGSIYLSYNSFGSPTAHFILAGVIILVIITLVYAFKSNTWKKIALKSSIDSKVLDITELNISIGDKGKTITRLAPMGRVMINNNSIEAKSTGPFIDENTEIQVVKVLNTNIVVKQLNK